MRPCPHALVISIHAPRAGSDEQWRLQKWQATISIHAPRAGSDRGYPARRYYSTIFQSTLPVRGATRGFGRGLKNVKNFNPRSPCGERRKSGSRKSGSRNFNPRSPCGERLCSWRLSLQRAGISIHAPRAGSDWFAGNSSNAASIFQSTLPVRGATTPYSGIMSTKSHFNPRSPCGERLVRRTQNNAIRNFNPRSPCGERHFSFTLVLGFEIFQSTLPVRGATSGERRQQRAVSNFSRAAARLFPYHRTRGGR